MRLGNKKNKGVIDDKATMHKFSDKVKVKATKLCKTMEEGKTYLVHRLQAEPLIAAKKAVAVMLCTFFLMLGLCFAPTEAKAQLDSLKTVIGGTVKTVTNTNTQTKRMYSIKYNGNHGNWTLCVIVHPGTGTPRGVIRPIGSTDGVAYDYVGSDTWTYSATDTVHHFDITDKKRMYYGAQNASDTTQATTWQSFITPRN
jgi:hypothetical protein